MRKQIPAQGVLKASAGDGIVAVVPVETFVKIRTKRGRSRNEGSALEILKKRYARGELSKEEFEEKKRDLL